MLLIGQFNRAHFRSRTLYQITKERMNGFIYIYKTSFFFICDRVV